MDMLSNCYQNVIYVYTHRLLLIPTLVRETCFFFLAWQQSMQRLLTDQNAENMTIE